MRNSFTLLFYLKKAKKNLTEAVPIYIRITVNGHRAELSTGREISIEKWNSSAGRAKGTKDESKVLNVFLDTLQTKLYDIQRKLIDANEIISAEIIKNKYTGKGENPTMLIPIFQIHNDQITALLGSEYSKGTLTRYNTALKHTKDFLKWKYNISDIDIRKVDHAFINDFEFYLRSECKCNNNSAVKYVKSNFGKIIRNCVANGWLERDPFINYKSKIREVNREFLDQNELELIASKVFTGDRLNQVRDIFLFSCYTGLAYIDVKQLTRDNINIGIDREKWIFTNRQKTDSPSHIPMLPVAEEIMNKYQDHPQCKNDGRLLPVLSNQKTNSYLKEIADVCGISKELTFHIARHTFATTVTLTNGVSIESVSKMLGHRSIKTTQHYAKILDQKVGIDMSMLKSKLQSDKLKTQGEIIALKVI